MRSAGDGNIATLRIVADHRRGRIVWGSGGIGEKAAGAFFVELDPEIAAACPPRDTNSAGQDNQPKVGRHASKLEAIARHLPRVRHLSSQARASGGDLHRHLVQLADQALDEVRRVYWNELRRPTRCSRRPTAVPTSPPYGSSITLETPRRPAERSSIVHPHIAKLREPHR